MKIQVLVGTLALLAVYVSGASVVLPNEIKPEQVIKAFEEADDKFRADDTELEPIEMVEYFEEVEDESQNEEELEPLQVIESADEIGPESEISFSNEVSHVKGTRSSVLFRGSYSRGGVANRIHVLRVSYRGRATTRIEAIRAVQVGANLGAKARVVAGGLRKNNVTVEIRSAKGRGLNVVVQVYGRY